MGEWMVLLFAISKEYDKVLYTPHNWLSPSLNNCHLHEISLFFVLSTYVEIILMRWLHDLIVTKLCQTPGDRLYVQTDFKVIWFVYSIATLDNQLIMFHISHISAKVSSLRVQPSLRLLLKSYFCDLNY